MQRLPEQIKVKHEKMKEEMIGLYKIIIKLLIYNAFPWYMYISISTILNFLWKKKKLQNLQYQAQ